MLESIYSSIILNRVKSLGRGSVWIIDSVIGYSNINILKYNPLAGSSCIKLPKELDHPRKGLIIIQNIDDDDDDDDDECCKWRLVRYLHPEDHIAGRIRKAYKDFSKNLILKTQVSHQN